MKKDLEILLNMMHPQGPGVSQSGIIWHELPGWFWEQLDLSPANSD